MMKIYLLVLSLLVSLNVIAADTQEFLKPVKPLKVIPNLKLTPYVISEKYITKTTKSEIMVMPDGKGVELSKFKNISGMKQLHINALAEHSPLDVVLSASSPIARHKARLRADNSMFWSAKNNVIGFTSNNEGSKLSYDFYVTKNKQYAIEIVLEQTWSKSSKVRSSLAGHDSTHSTKVGETTTISSVVKSDGNGWVSGQLYFGESSSGWWFVSEVKIKEIN